MKRNRFGAAFLGALATIAFAGAAKAEDLVVATFGGVFADDTKTCVIQPFERRTGAKVALQLGNSVQHAAAIRATAGKSNYDVAYMDNSLATQIGAEGLLTSLDTGKLTSYPDVDKAAFGPNNTYVAFEISATAITYNPKVVDPAPTSWNDLFDPKYRGRIAIGDITGTSGMQFLLAVNKMRGGSFDDMNPGFAAIKALADNSVTLYTQADQLVSLFQRGDIVIAPWYPDRTGAQIDKGLDLAVAYPKEGAVGIKPTLVIPKGAPHPDLALKYVDAVLSTEAQTCFSSKQYAAPVNTKVALPDRVKKIVATGEDYKKLWFPDPKLVASHLVDWNRRWQREVVH
ncbi:MAG: ABC transporter substrate-binding protein [Pseudomonadota bacterium]|nr:ABC transporter substrate-binding protein [Pseudomonadota bacterium]